MVPQHPTPKNKQDTKQLLLQRGMELLLEKGYDATGIKDVLDLANVPKGSFYYYFPSKEAFCVEIIHYY
ncbi:MAG: TetR/AcrR family transcriptional regulator, partial [Cyanobacteria bacterium]|nr:TetR/AcrR family transcriptional regulator [Cyanobacteriota bacterium]